MRSGDLPQWGHLQTFACSHRIVPNAFLPPEDLYRLAISRQELAYSKMKDPASQTPGLF